MKIVDRKTFLALPAGTLFSKYQPCFFGELCIKGDTLDHCNDFLYDSIADAIVAHDSGEFSVLLEQSQVLGTDVQMDFTNTARDGCFEADQLFAVWNLMDTMTLIKRLFLACNQVVDNITDERNPT